MTLGQRVVCLNGEGLSDAGLNWKYQFPKTGSIYTIRASEPYWEDEKVPAVRLEEILNEEHFYSGLGRSMEVHFRADRFALVEGLS